MATIMGLLFSKFGYPRACYYDGFQFSRYVGTPLDIFGGRFSKTLGFGLRAGNQICFVFEHPDGPFHTTHRWNPENGTRELSHAGSELLLHCCS